MRPARTAVASVLLATVALSGCGDSAGGGTTTAGTAVGAAPAAADPAATVRTWVAATLVAPHVVRATTRTDAGAAGLDRAGRTRLARLLPPTASVLERVGTDGRERVAARSDGVLDAIVGGGRPTLASANGRRWLEATDGLAAAIDASGASRQAGLTALRDPALDLQPVPGSDGRRVRAAATPALVGAVLPQLSGRGVLAVRDAEVEVALDGERVTGWTVSVQAVADLGRLAGAGRRARVGVAAVLGAAAGPSAAPAEPAATGSAATLAALSAG